MIKLVIVLISAHAIGDFLIQTSWIAERKKKIYVLFLHAVSHAVLAYAILQAWFCWQVPVFILLVHFLIDFVRQRWCKDTASAFVLDQIIHVACLLVLAKLLVWSSILEGFLGIGYKPIVLLAGFVTTIRGSGFLIERVAKRIVLENGLELAGLKNGGQIIGQLERTLIFVFIFSGQPAGIGFLVAAKSILRFDETKKQELAEYVLIGTLLSFSLAIILASATKWAMAL